MAALKGADLLRWLLLPIPQLPTLTKMAFAHSTTLEHLRLLKRLGTDLDHDLHEVPLATAPVEWLTRERRRRRWRWSTTLKTAASLQGAIGLLPVYRTGTRYRSE